MFRGITNRFAGRKKVADESMDYSAVQKLLTELNGATRINVKYNSCGDCATFTERTPTDVAELVAKEFRPNNGKYCDANHQVFEGEQDEKHYVDLREGKIIATVGNQEQRGNLWSQATLEYVLQHKE
jgi:hypothetical protein